MKLDASEKDPIKIADWIELQTLISGTQDYSFERLRTDLEIDGALAEEAEVDHYVQSQSQISEDLLALVLEEIERRISLIGEAYPFQLKSEILSAQLRMNYLPYILCLLISDREYYQPCDKFPEMTFEKLAGEVIREIIRGDYARFGHPRDELPTGILDAIGELSKLMGNRRISPGYATNANDKDLGLDIAAWRDFPDKAFNKLQIFIQCATGEDWDRKKGDCNLDEWRGILFFAFSPVLSLAIPYIISRDDWERKACGIFLLDRIRISTSIDGLSLARRKKDWWTWCKKRIQEMK